MFGFDHMSRGWLAGSRAVSAYSKLRRASAPSSPITSDAPTLMHTVSFDADRWTAAGQSARME